MSTSGQERRIGQQERIMAYYEKLCDLKNPLAPRMRKLTIKHKSKNEDHYDFQLPLPAGMAKTMQITTEDKEVLQSYKKETGELIVRKAKDITTDPKPDMVNLKNLRYKTHIRKSGGTSTGTSYDVTVSKKIIKEMGITKDDRRMFIRYQDGEIIAKKI